MKNETTIANIKVTIGFYPKMISWLEEVERLGSFAWFASQRGVPLLSEYKSLFDDLLVERGEGRHYKHSSITHDPGLEEIIFIFGICSSGSPKRLKYSKNILYRKRICNFKRLIRTP